MGPVVRRVPSDVRTHRRRSERARILGCGDGPAGFNALAITGVVGSCRAIRSTNSPEARFAARIEATSGQVLEQTRANAGAFVWNDAIPTVEALGIIRMEAMGIFLEDFEAGKADGRYIAGGLPRLPFADRAFDLALCSHFLFLYTSQLGEAFHLEAVRELCRVAAEVRIFPLLDLDGQRFSARRPLPVVVGTFGTCRSVRAGAL